MADNKRKKRIEDLIQRELGMLLLNYPKQSVFNKVTITAVDVAPNLSHAKIFFSVFDETNVEETKKNLQNEAKFLRKSLARDLNLRLTPRLDFLYDESIEHGRRIDELIKHKEAEIMEV